MDEHEIRRRISQVEQGRRDPHKDYDIACENVKLAHDAFKRSYGKTGPSIHAQEVYAKALRDLELATHVLELTNALAKAS
jgi:hypothetical protein